MPQFEVLSISEARANSVTGKQAQLLQEYISYVESVPSGQAGKLVAGPGETTNALRRRLGKAAKAVGKRLKITRADKVVFFWADDTGRRRGPRPRAT